MIYLETQGTIDSTSPITQKKPGAKYGRRFILRQFGNTNQATGYKGKDQYYDIRIFRPKREDLEKLPIVKGKVVRCKLALYGNQFSTNKGLNYNLSLMANEVTEVN